MLLTRCNYHYLHLRKEGRKERSPRVALQLQQLLIIFRKKKIKKLAGTKADQQTHTYTFIKSMLDPQMMEESDMYLISVD